MPAPAATPPRFLHVGSCAPLGRGLYSFALAPDGGLQPLGLTPNAGSPSAVLADTGRRLVYAAEEGSHHIAVYAQDDTGSLRLLQREPSGGLGPCQLGLAANRLWAAH